MKKHFFTILFLSISFNLFAQSEEQTFKRHIGFNTNIFQTPSFPVFAVMYKSQNKENRAFRLGANFGMGIENNSQYQTLNSYFLQIGIGKEFQSTINKHWMWYQGADIMPTFGYSLQENTQNGVYQKNESKNYVLELRPFLGIRYNINSRLYISTEANFNLRYSQNFNSSSTTGITVETQNFSARLNPAVSLFFFYLF